MPWHVDKSDRCPASRPWAVIKDADGAIEGCHASKADANKQLAALYANEEASMSNKDREVRTFPFEVEEVRAAEGGRSKDFTIKGHAAVYNTWTDLGIFRERIAKGAFDDVLSRDPHVLHLIDHDTRYVLSSTRSKTLELRSDPKGLHMWSKVAPTTYAADLRVLMERGDVSQSSFAFTVPDDGQKWKENDDGTIERTITRVGELFDVTTTAMGAYPTTDSQVAMRTLEHARSLAEAQPDSTPEEEEADVAAPEEADDQTEAPLPDEEAAEEASATAQDNPAARAQAALLVLKEAARKRSEQLQEASWQVLKEK